MTNRTVKFMGAGFGATPAKVTATFDGQQIFSGNVITVNQPMPLLPDQALVDQTQLLFSFEIPMNLSGNIPMAVLVENNPVIFAQIDANYANCGNLVGNTAVYNSSGPNDYPVISRAPRQGVQIDGVPQDDPIEAGCGWWTVYPGSTMTYNLVVDAGLE